MADNEFVTRTASGDALFLKKDEDKSLRSSDKEKDSSKSSPQKKDDKGTLND